MAPERDLRDWLCVVRAAGELVEVPATRWDLELDSISQLKYRRPATDASRCH